MSLVGNISPSSVLPQTTMPSSLAPDAVQQEDPLVAAKIAALASPCFFHRRIDDAVNIQDILADESVSHSRLLQTVTSVREAARQLQRRPMRRAVRNVMIVTKARDNDLVVLTRELTEWLLTTPRYGASLGVTVYVDHKLRNSKRFDASGLLSQNEHFEKMLKFWTPDMCWSTPEKFDLVLTLGGDGTVLFTSWLFQRIVPPVLSFSLGSLGFLTPFDFGDFRKHLDHVMGGVSSTVTAVPTRRSSTSSAIPPSPLTLHQPNPTLNHHQRADLTLSALVSLNLNDPSHQSTRPHSPASPLTLPPSSPDLVADAGMRVNLRMRFTCSVHRANPAVKSNTNGATLSPSHTETASFEVLNELVIDRGPSPYVSNLELYACDDSDPDPSPNITTSSPSTSTTSTPETDNLLTIIQADGVIFSTPTGSTAYSLSAGGSLVHPDIPAILLTPICPHTLSFRPMLLDDAMALRVAVPKGSRATAWCSFDGKGRVELRQGDYVTISASKYPFPVVEAGRLRGKGRGTGTGGKGWVETVSKTLRWNIREARQKAWTSTGTTNNNARATRPGMLNLGQPDTGLDLGLDGDEEECDGEEQDEGFDIDFDDPDPAGEDETCSEQMSSRDSGYGGDVDGQSKGGSGSGSSMGGTGPGTGTSTPVRKRSGGALGLGC